ncbi:cipC-like antibiotic response protein [Aspergillus sp. HF37]|nr:cipC-like antibiotic response protein [Aspergillus sp. HF37]
MAFGWGDSEHAHRQVYHGEAHEASLTHELLAGAASFEAMKLWEDYQRKQGKSVSHSFAKEAIAGIVGSQIDRLAETKGMDELEKHKAKRHAEENAHQMYSEHYEREMGAGEYDPGRYRAHHSYRN